MSYGQIDEICNIIKRVGEEYPCEWNKLLLEHVLELSGRIKNGELDEKTIVVNILKYIKDMNIFLTEEMISNAK